MAKIIVRKLLPNNVLKGFRATVDRLREWKTAIDLDLLRRRMCSISSGTNKAVRLVNHNILIHDGPSYYALYKDVFIKKIYHFEAQRPDPLILDCGSHIGGVILYFKRIYPRARIIGFEADPDVFPLLQENISHNNLTDVQLVRAALSAKEGTSSYYSDGGSGSCLAENLPRDDISMRTEWEVPSIRLRDYLTEPVDFLKINIEGAEWEVLADSEDRLPYVREMVIEYHHWPGLPRTLHKILDLLHRQGYEYLINDFDSATNSVVQPPFRLTPETRYFLLIYARRL